MKGTCALGLVCVALLFVAAGSWAEEKACCPSEKPCPIVSAEADPAPVPVAVTPERGMRARGEQGDLIGTVLGKLNLTEEQKAQIKPIREKQMEEMKTLRADTTVPREEMWQKARAANEKYRAEIMGILTEEQKAEAEKLMAEARQKAREGQRPEMRNRQGRREGEGQPKAEGQGAGQRRGRGGEGKKAE